MRRDLDDLLGGNYFHRAVRVTPAMRLQARLDENGDNHLLAPLADYFFRKVKEHSSQKEAPFDFGNMIGIALECYIFSPNELSALIEHVATAAINRYCAPPRKGAPCPSPQ